MAPSMYAVRHCEVGLVHSSVDMFPWLSFASPVLVRVGVVRQARVAGLLKKKRTDFVSCVSLNLVPVRAGKVGIRARQMKCSIPDLARAFLPTGLQ